MDDGYIEDDDVYTGIFNNNVTDSININGLNRGTVDVSSDNVYSISSK